jgi:hypothetical protein
VTLDDLQRAWRRRGAPEGAAESPARELEAARARARELEAMVRRRDRLETLVAFALLPIFSYFALRADGWMVRLGAAILAVSCLAIPLRLRGARRPSPDPGLPVATFLRLQLELVLNQRRLLLTVPLWYLGPLGLGVILFFAGSSASPWLTVLYAALVVASFTWLYRLNRNAVTQELEPRARELRLWIELAGEGDDAKRGKETER